MINSGAIMTTSLIKPHLADSDKYSYMRKYWMRLAAGRVTFDNTVYLSERVTADTNYALAYLMRSKNAFPEEPLSIQHCYQKVPTLSEHWNFISSNVHFRGTLS